MTGMALDAPKRLEPLPEQSQLAVSATAVDIETLIHTSYDAVYRLALAILETPADAEDAAQETFIAAARALSKFRGDTAVKTWLFAIAVNQCRATRRRRKWRQVLWTVLQKAPLAAANPPLPESSLTLSETQTQLATAVRQLKQKHRLTIILRYANGLTTPEIARVLKVSENTVYSRLHYARNYLRQYLAYLT